MLGDIPILFDEDESRCAPFGDASRAYGPAMISRRAKMRGPTTRRPKKKKRATGRKIVSGNLSEYKNSTRKGFFYE